MAAAVFRSLEVGAVVVAEATVAAAAVTVADVEREKCRRQPWQTLKEKNLGKKKLKI